jgi:hypothetical protein
MVRSITTDPLRSARAVAVVVWAVASVVLWSSTANSAEIAFVENVGQLDPEVRFHARAGDLEVFVTLDALWLVWVESHAPPEVGGSELVPIPLRTVNLRLTFAGSNPLSLPRGEGAVSTRVSYLIGPEPGSWHRRVPVWGSLRLSELYPGVDLIVDGRGGRLELLLTAERSGDLRAVRPVLDGAEGLATDRGALILADGTRLELPTIGASLRGGERVQLPPEWPLHSPLEPPPAENQRLDGLTWAGFLGGSDEDCSFRCAVVLDAVGAAYVTGLTASSDFPTTPGAYDTSVPVLEDAFVAKISADGATLEYATLLGGSDEDWGRAITVDGAGRAIVTGHTRSDGFPTTPGAFDRTHQSTLYPDDGFITILSADGSDLVYSTFFGGSAEEIGKSIAVDGSGRVYVGGATQSSDFPATPGSYDPTYNPPAAGGGELDGFVLALDPGGNGAADLAWASFLGSGHDEWVDALAIGDAGTVSVVGTTSSPGFPTTPGAWITADPGGRNAFAARFDALGANLVYATLIGGAGDEGGDALAVGNDGVLYVQGFTTSSSFPTTPGAYDRVLGGSRDLWVVKLAGDGSGPLYSTLVGGSDGEYSGSTLAFAGDGSLIATGGTRSTDFPTTPGCPDHSLNGLEDAVVFVLDPDGSELRYSTYLGGWHWDFGYGVSATPRGAVVVGRTRSYDFPASTGSFGDTFGGGACLAGQPCSDAFLGEVELPIIFGDGFDDGDISAWSAHGP